MKKKIRVLLADDHPVVRKGIRSCLSHRDNMEVVGEAGTGQEALVLARQLVPDLVLMDIDMPGMSGLAVTETLARELAQVRVLILSMYDHSEYVMRILQSGARGYILKEASTEDLIRAIETVNSGESFFSPEFAKVALNQFVQAGGDPNPGQLTDREREVLIHIAEGLSNKEIASVLNLGVRTVETHRERIMRKLDIHSVAGLTKFAISKGLITLQEEKKL